MSCFPALRWLCPRDVGLCLKSQWSARIAPVRNVSDHLNNVDGARSAAKAPDSASPLTLNRLVPLFESHAFVRVILHLHPQRVGYPIGAWRLP